MSYSSCWHVQYSTVKSFFASQLLVMHLKMSFGNPVCNPFKRVLFHMPHQSIFCVNIVNYRHLNWSFISNIIHHRPNCSEFLTQSSLVHLCTSWLIRMFNSTRLYCSQLLWCIEACPWLQRNIFVHDSIWNYCLYTHIVYQHCGSVDITVGNHRYLDQLGVLVQGHFSVACFPYFSVVHKVRYTDMYCVCTLTGHNNVSTYWTY